MLWSDFERSVSAWDPWREIERIEQRFSELPFSGNQLPEVNIFTSGNGALLRTEIPGIDPASIDVSVEGKTLTVSGSRSTDVAGEEGTFHRRERWQGRFTRTVEVPFLIDPDKVNANFNRGVLEITLPRAAADLPKKITVKTA